MTFDDKSAHGGEPQISEIPGGLPENTAGYTFSDLVDETCEKLKERQIKHSIRRIQEMEGRLFNLEKELDDFLLQKER
jgi:hypothetical protein